MLLTLHLYLFSTVHYVGKYGLDVFEDKEIEFIVGEGEEQGLIPGLETAVLKMKKGEKCRLEISSSQGYGVKGNPKFSIPPGASLTYDVEMIQFEKVNITIISVLQSN